MSALRRHATVVGQYLLVVLMSSFAVTVGETGFQVGASIYDITGPAAQVNMMGYAQVSQTTKGIHMRLYSRAFVFADNDGGSRFVFVSIDTCMASQGVKLEVIKRLQTIYNGLYTERNVGISATHTHSGPGGYNQYLLYSITSLGFVKESFDPLVDGIVESIRQAHDSVRPANVYLSIGELLDSNINRSPAAYLSNPPGERARYTHNVDTEMTLLRIEDDQGRPMGMINWFAVHPTSMNNTNELISGDNKGYASLLFERHMLKQGGLSTPGRFVAAFAQSNLGDVSPNTNGPRCVPSGLPCDFLTSSCGPKIKREQCIASGPGEDMFESTKVIGEKQFEKALELFSSGGVKLSGPVDFRHSYVDMTNVNVQVNATHQVKTCKPAMGYSFAAGTTDGPGSFCFEQGTTNDNPFWNIIRNFLTAPSPEQIECHKPKPILLATGEYTFPYPWQPKIVDVQLFRLGQLVIILPPAEFTTMAGRRTRNAVKQAMANSGVTSDLYAVIAGLSNDYASYVTTFEEYQVQRYEAASTIYGPHTLQAFIQSFVLLAEAIAFEVGVLPGPNPPNLIDRQLCLLPPVFFDTKPLFSNYGDVLADALPSYTPGSNVKVTFRSANPRNDLQIGGTYLTVEQKHSNESWQVVYTDADWETKYKWKAPSALSGRSKAVIRWDIPLDQAPGTYRIRHFGRSKSFLGIFTDFIGQSSEFEVVG